MRTKEGRFDRRTNSTTRGGYKKSDAGSRNVLSNTAGDCLALMDSVYQIHEHVTIELIQVSFVKIQLHSALVHQLDASE